jgi:hypothetical protein
MWGELRMERVILMRSDRNAEQDTGNLRKDIFVLRGKNLTEFCPYFGNGRRQNLKVEN